MRGCLAFLVFVAVLIGALAFGVVRLALPALVDSAVRGSPLIHGQPVSVVTNASIEGVLLGGRIDGIEISGRDVSEPNAEIGSVDVTLRDVSILDRTFGSADGRLTGVTLELGDGQRVTADTVALSGSGASLSATIGLSSGEAEAAIRSRLQAAGLPVEVIRLDVGRIQLTVAGRSLFTDLRLSDGGLALEVDDLARVPLFEAPTTGEWRVEAVGVTPAGIQLTVRIALG